MHLKPKASGFVNLWKLYKLPQNKRIPALKSFKSPLWYFCGIVIFCFFFFAWYATKLKGKNTELTLIMQWNLKAVVDEITYGNVIILNHKAPFPWGLRILSFSLNKFSGCRDNLISAHRRWWIETFPKKSQTLSEPSEAAVSFLPGWAVCHRISFLSLVAV